jgi:hypothetical protein
MVVLINVSVAQYFIMEKKISAAKKNYSLPENRKSKYKKDMTCSVLK